MRQVSPEDYPEIIFDCWPDYIEVNLMTPNKRYTLYSFKRDTVFTEDQAQALNEIEREFVSLKQSVQQHYSIRPIA